MRARKASFTGSWRQPSGSLGPLCVAREAAAWALFCLCGLALALALAGTSWATVHTVPLSSPPKAPILGVVRSTFAPYHHDDIPTEYPDRQGTCQWRRDSSLWHISSTNREIRQVTKKHKCLVAIAIESHTFGVIAKYTASRRALEKDRPQQEIRKGVKEKREISSLVRQESILPTIPPAPFLTHLRRNRHNW